MSKVRDKQIIEELKRTDGDRVKIGVIDIDGILRGKIMEKEKFLSSIKDGFGFCNVIFGWDSQDHCYEDTDLIGWHTGYPDGKAHVNLQSMRRLPWDKSVPMFIADFSQDETLGLVCPRSLFKRIVSQAEEMMYVPMMSSEFEWFNYKKGLDDVPADHPITSGMFGYSLLRMGQSREFVNDLWEGLQAGGIPIEGLHTETGPGVYEAAIKYTTALEAADRAALFKWMVKEIAHQHGIMPSFMAKPSVDLPGCSGHIHQSLWDKIKRKNVFADANGKQGMSNIMQHYIAGQLFCLPYILPMYAPTVNSYKRLVSGSWAATSVSWGIENRTTALRAIIGSSKSTRLETRVPGADTNPYLSMAAALASGLYGIRHKIELTQAPTTGNEYQSKGHRQLPKTLSEATALMKQSEIPTELFGETFVQHFVQSREWEWNQYRKAVTDWEVNRYFEII